MSRALTRFQQLATIADVHMIGGAAVHPDTARPAVLSPYHIIIGSMHILTSTQFRPAMLQRSALCQSDLATECLSIHLSIPQELVVGQFDVGFYSHSGNHPMQSDGFQSPTSASHRGECFLIVQMVFCSILQWHHHCLAVISPACKPSSCTPLMLRGALPVHERASSTPLQT
jgi:hypothetical protein